MRTKILSSIIVLLILIGAAFYFTRKPVQEPVACTADALLCPDGSGVGRTGPSCEFSACPDGASFEGTLRQNQNGFQLLIPAPDISPQEVTYVLPLSVHTTEPAVSSFVGKRVVVSGAFTKGNTYRVDALEAAQNPDPTTGDVGVGETKLINGVKITLNAVLQDSRCPVDVVCIQGGAINTNVTLQSDTDRETLNMPSDEVPHAFDSFKVSIVDINPPRISHQEVDPQAFRITFKVVPLQ
jgi:hypothetical protein